MTIPRIFSSAKFQAAFVATALSASAFIFSATDKNLDRPHKLEAAQTFIKFVCGIWFAAIAGTSFEDAAEKHGVGAPAQPSVTVNAPENQTVNAATETLKPIVLGPQAKPVTTPESVVVQAKPAEQSYQPTFLPKK